MFMQCEGCGIEVFGKQIYCENCLKESKEYLKERLAEENRREWEFDLDQWTDEEMAGWLPILDETNIVWETYSEFKIKKEKRVLVKVNEDTEDLEILGVKCNKRESAAIARVLLRLLHNDGKFDWDIDLENLYRRLDDEAVHGEIPF